MTITKKIKAVAIDETAGGGKRYRYREMVYPGKPRKPFGEKRSRAVHISVSDRVAEALAEDAARRKVSLSWRAYELICAGLGVPTGADGPWTATWKQEGGK